MNKDGIVKQITSKAKDNGRNYTQQDIEYILNCFSEVLLDNVGRGEKSIMQNLFSVEVRRCKGRIGMDVVRNTAAKYLNGTELNLNLQED